MEKVLGALGAVAVLVGIAGVAMSFSGKATMVEAIAAIVAGLSLLFAYELLGAVKEIRDTLKSRDQ